MFTTSAAGGALALLKTGDRVRIDISKGHANMLVDEDEIARRKQELENSGGYRYPESQTPWQELQRSQVEQLSDGMVLKDAVKYQRIAAKGVPRDNH